MDGTDAARTLGLVALQIADSHFRPTRRGVLSERSRIRSEEYEILSEPFVSATRSGVIASRRPLGAPHVRLVIKSTIFNPL